MTPLLQVSRSDDPPEGEETSTEFDANSAGAEGVSTNVELQPDGRVHVARSPTQEEIIVSLIPINYLLHS